MIHINEVLMRDFPDGISTWEEGIYDEGDCHMKHFDLTVFPRMARHGRTILCATALMATATMLPKSADAASVSIFLIADHTAPTTSGEVTTLEAYELSNLNNSDKARSVTEVTDFTFDIGTSLSFSSLTDPATGPSSGAPNTPFLTDQDEPDRNTLGYIDFETSTWDNSGLTGTTEEVDDQMDLGRNSRATFNAPTGGFTDLILADLGGLNPFTLNLCATADCSTAERIFNGFSSGLTNTLLALSNFASSDGVSGAEDQVWLFRFSETITDYVQVVENDNRSVFTGDRLQVDYLGATTPGSISPVPGPASLPLLAGGFILMGWVMRRKPA